MACLDHNHFCEVAMNAKTNLSVNPAESVSKSKLNIEPRKVRFDYSEINKPDFFGGNYVASAFFTALSITFPPGEAEFIHSVRYFEKKIKDPKLKADVKDFAAQEAHHGLQHKKLNKQFESLGYQVSTIEEKIDQKLTEREIIWSPAKRLRRTVAAEHFTATMAHHALTNPDLYTPSGEVFKDLMLWHAIEEVEHKSVAFDVYEQCVGDMRALRWHYLHFALVEFPLQYWLMTRFLLKQGGFKVTWRERREFLSILFGRRGIFSSHLGLYTKFLKKGFHPWQHDDSSLVGKWKDKLAGYFIGQSADSQTADTTPGSVADSRVG